MPLVISARLMDEPLGNLDDSPWPLLPVPTPCLGLNTLPNPVTSQESDNGPQVRSETEWGGGGAVLVMGGGRQPLWPYLSALLWDNWEGCWWLPSLLGAWDRGQTAPPRSFSAGAPPHTYTPAVHRNTLARKELHYPLLSPSHHYSYPLGTCVRSLHCNDNLCWFMCFFTRVFYVLCVCMRGFMACVCVCVCPRT